MGESVLRFLKCVCVCCLGVVHTPVQSTHRTLPPFHVHQSSHHACLVFYGGDGILKTYDQIKEKSYGVQTMKKQEKRAEARAQLVVDKRAKKRSGTAGPSAKKQTTAASTSTNTAAEDAAICRYDADNAPDPIPPPSNQLASLQKRCRTPSTTQESPAWKQGRQDSPNLEEGSSTQGIILAPDSDVEMKDSKGENEEEDEEEDEEEEEFEELKGDTDNHQKSLSPEPSQSGRIPYLCPAHIHSLLQVQL